MKFYTAIFLCISILWAKADDKAAGTYYQIGVEGQTAGYIEAHPPLLVNHNRDIAKMRKTYTYLKFPDKPESERQIFEKSLYRKPEQVFFYALEYIQGNLWEEYRYWFEKDKVIAILTRNGQKVHEREMTLRPGVCVVTDYFSLIPFLEQTSRHRTLFVVDPKQIDMGRSSIVPTQMTITPQGERILALNWKQYVAQVFLIEWEGKTLRYWMAPRGELLQIEDTASGTTISRTSPDRLRQFLQPPSTSAVSGLPFEPGRNYRYLFYLKEKQIGDMNIQLQPDAAQYCVFVQGAFPQAESPYRFESQTIYGADWHPIFYHITEGNDIEIECDFVVQNVKVKYRRGEHLLERIVKLPDNALLIDNNGIHHFAALLAGAPNLGKSGVAIFHPRRLQCGEAAISIVRDKEGNIQANVETDYYKLQLWSDHQGHLIRYVQGDLEVRLEGK